jgi:hypothetical protein
MAIKEVTRFLASDGSQWNSRTAAEKREKLVKMCDDLVKGTVGKKPTLGHGSFKQQDPSLHLSFWSGLVEITKKNIKWEDKWGDDFRKIHPMGLIPRIISDSDLVPLDRLWNRLACFDKNSREWDQPYFAIQADKTK